MGNQFTSCCEFHRLSEDDEIQNVNDEQEVEKAATEGDDEDNQEEDWNILKISYQYSDQSRKLMRVGVPYVIEK